ncbi:MAG: hypothetical protein EA400_15315 [Chromatiaceae bacterium]|nr:MAG: hypothetical protein EA400_15315 [Chromatiaceae bacterium]
MASRSRAASAPATWSRPKTNGRVLSEGTFRNLGMLALTGAREPQSLVGFEEPRTVSERWLRRDLDD